jgi:hypothetical protein
LFAVSIAALISWAHAIGAVNRTTKIAKPTHEKTSAVVRSFEKGVPFDSEATIGDLVNAAWRIFRFSENNKYEQQGRSPVGYLADLVMKSIEIYEIRKHVI